ncbi:hypothetical protein QFC22_004500 [Naganishia vaughanmartiniae]|uniref:Uncharacterized protein n=1 Tax=Naganishia vaughanmartiniae TaxID=1424756 RepID=A0ACC2X2M0_9TREE|nr:hypothetical protein QFC22_004500 [Naganishia vaughanmartiniae]
MPEAYCPLQFVDPFIKCHFTAVTDGISRVPSASLQSFVSRQDEYRPLTNSSETPGSLEPRVSTTSSPRHKTGVKDALNKDMLKTKGGNRDEPGRTRSTGSAGKRKEPTPRAQSPSNARLYASSGAEPRTISPRVVQANTDGSSKDTSPKIDDASKKLNVHLASGQSRGGDPKREKHRSGSSSRISTSRHRHREYNGNKVISFTSDDSDQQPGRSQTSGKGHIHDADSKNRNPPPDFEDPTGVDSAHSDGAGAKQDSPKATGRDKSTPLSRRESESSSPPSTSRSPVRKEDPHDSDSSYEIRDDPPASSNSAKPPTTTKSPAEDPLRASDKSSGASPPPPISKPTGSPAITGLKMWIANLSSQRLGVGIALAVAIVCVLSSGSGGPSGSGLTRLAGGGIFLVALAAIGLWAWYQNSSKGKERERNSVEGSTDSVDGRNKERDGDGGDDPSDSEDEGNDGNGKGDRKGKHSRNLSNGRTDSHDRDRDMSEKCHMLHQQAEDRARELFPEVPRHLVLNALDVYAKAPWTKTTTEVRTENSKDRTRTRTKTEDGIRELEKAVKEVWKENPHGKSFSKHFEQLDHQLREEARELFAGLLSCNGAYLSGDLFRVELMLEVPIAIRVTTFPGERLIARPGENKKDGVKQSYHKEKENWYKGLETLSMMKKRWDKLPLPDVPEMPPVEIVCVRPPADFTPNEFERIRRLEVDSSAYRKEKRAFGRACSAQRNAGDFAQGPRREWILDLLLTTRPDCVQIDFLPHRRHQAEILAWNDLSSTSTFRHIGRFVDVIGALSDYTSKHELGMLDVGPCLPLTKDGVRTSASLLEKFAGKFSFKTARVKILRVGLEDPSVLRPDFSEANEVAMTLCDLEVEALDMFQPLSEGAIPSFLLETVNMEQVETYKKTVASEFERRLISNLYVATKLLHFMGQSYYALPNQRPCPRIWPPGEWQILDDRVAAVLKEKAGK